MSGKCHNKRIWLISCGTGCTPYLQILSKALDQSRNNFLIQKLPLIRIAVKLRNIDRQIIDKFFKAFLICLQAFDIIFITDDPVFRDQCINPTLHLLFLVSIQIYFGQLIYFFFKVFIIIYHRFTPQKKKQAACENMQPISILCHSVLQNYSSFSASAAITASISTDTTSASASSAFSSG